LKFNWTYGELTRAYLLASALAFCLMRTTDARLLRIGAAISLAFCLVKGVQGLYYWLNLDQHERVNRLVRKLRGERSS
jgi:hypothetical protein